MCMSVFIAESFSVVKMQKQDMEPIISIGGWALGVVCVYTHSHNGKLPRHKNEILPFVIA